MAQPAQIVQAVPTATPIPNAQIVPVPPLQRDWHSSYLRWKDYFRENTPSLWNNVPRVFARELYGLELFGYVPVFKDQQLLFTRGVSYQQHPVINGFNQYLNCLNAKGYFNANNRAQTLNNISEYLFGDPNVLG